MGLVVAVTAILNLDTSVWFLTPVLVHAARARSRRAAVSLRLAVVLGTIARTTGWFQQVVEEHARWTVAALAAGVSIACNNLPAAVLLASHQPTHARALLIGLNLGPNLFVTGSLSAYLWWRAAQTVAAPTSVKTYARIGVVLVPLSMAAALIALQLFSNG